MGFSLWTLLKAALLITNALAILNENRFLHKYGLHEITPNVDSASIKNQAVSLLQAVRWLRVKPQSKNFNGLKMCWPVVDIGTKRDFRKNAQILLKVLEEDGSLPPGSSRMSLLQFPQGVRVELLVWHFSTYALHYKLRTLHQATSHQKDLRINMPIWRANSIILDASYKNQASIASEIQCLNAQIEYQFRLFKNHAIKVSDVQIQWSAYANELTAKIRCLLKEIEELKVEKSEITKRVKNPEYVLSDDGNELLSALLAANRQTSGKIAAFLEGSDFTNGDHTVSVLSERNNLGVAPSLDAYDIVNEDISLTAKKNLNSNGIEILPHIEKWVEYMESMIRQLNNNATTSSGNSDISITGIVEVAQDMSSNVFLPKDEMIYGSTKSNLDIYQCHHDNLCSLMKQITDLISASKESILNLECNSNNSIIETEQLQFHQPLFSPAVATPRFKNKKNETIASRTPYSSYKCGKSNRDSSSVDLSGYHLTAPTPAHTYVPRNIRYLDTPGGVKSVTIKRSKSVSFAPSVQFEESVREQSHSNNINNINDNNSNDSLDLSGTLLQKQRSKKTLESVKRKALKQVRFSRQGNISKNILYSLRDATNETHTQDDSCTGDVTSISTTTTTTIVRDKMHGYDSETPTRQLEFNNIDISSSATTTTSLNVEPVATAASDSPHCNESKDDLCLNELSSMAFITNNKIPRSPIMSGHNVNSKSNENSISKINRKHRFLNGVQSSTTIAATPLGKHTPLLNTKKRNNTCNDTRNEINSSYSVIDIENSGDGSNNIISRSSTMISPKNKWMNSPLFSSAMHGEESPLMTQSAYAKKF